MGGANRADSTRKGYAASVTLLRREQLRKVVRPYKRYGAKSSNGRQGRDVIFIRLRVEKAGMIWYNTPLMKSKQEVTI